MNEDILYVSFLLGIKEIEFQLPLKSYRKLEAAGKHIENVYELEVSSKCFLEFYKYIRDKYGSEEAISIKLVSPNKATISQKKEVFGQPWKHLLTVQNDLWTESIIFHPDSCGLENEEEDTEYQEDLKRANMINSLVTTLPEEYRDTEIKEKPLDKLIRLTEEADLYKYGQDYKE